MQTVKRYLRIVRKVIQFSGLTVAMILIAIGSCALLGAGSWLTWIIVSVCGLSVASLLKGEGHLDREKRKACVDLRKDIYDSMIDQGKDVMFGGKPWRKGCRIDPETDVMIEPA